jgi:hypothetical protein
MCSSAVIVVAIVVASLFKVAMSQKLLTPTRILGGAGWHDLQNARSYDEQYAIFTFNDTDRIAPMVVLTGFQAPANTSAGSLNSNAGSILLNVRAGCQRALAQLFNPMGMTFRNPCTGFAEAPAVATLRVLMGTSLSLRRAVPWILGPSSLGTGGSVGGGGALPTPFLGLVRSLLWLGLSHTFCPDLGRASPRSGALCSRGLDGRSAIHGRNSTRQYRTLGLRLGIGPHSQLFLSHVPLWAAQGQYH